MENQRCIQPAVAAVIFNEKGEVLLQKRKDVNQWCILCGHVDFGETVEAAILREIVEEANTEGQIIRFIGVYSSPESQTYVYTDRTVQYITTYFEVKLSGAPPINFSNEETIELRFFPIDQIPENFAQINSFWLTDALDRSGKVFIR
jgi:8-oxo-dGTP pyrophosphatase MutT (NUDIX family)